MGKFTTSEGFTGVSGKFGSPPSWSDGVSDGTVGSFGQGNNPFAGSLGRNPAEGQAPSARRADEEYKGLVDADKAGAGLLDGILGKRKPRPPKPRPPARHGSSGGHSARETFEYYESPIAERYGFGKETAYQEALANTAYRREMADMKKAGLNPSVIYGSHNTSGADSSIIPRSSSGGGGGSSRRYGSRKGSNYVFSGGAYYGIMAATSLATTLITKNAGAGMAAGAMAATAMKALNGFFKK